MIKQKIFVFLLFSIAVSTILIQCAEEHIEQEAVHFGVKPKFKIEIEHAEFLYLKNENLDKIINYTKFQIKNKRLFSPIYNFEINENLVQIIEHENYNTYTFEIIRNDVTEYKIENYMVKMSGNTLIAHYLISYPYQIIDGQKIINYTASTNISLQNPEWMPQGRGVNCPPGQTQILENVESFSVPVVVKCTGGGHEPNDPDCNCGTTDPNCQPGYITISTTTILTWSCAGGSGGNGGNGDNYNNGGNNLTITNPFTNPEKTDCEELNELLDTSKQNIKPILENLKTLAGSSLNYENGYLR